MIILKQNCTKLLLIVACNYFYANIVLLNGKILAYFFLQLLKLCREEI